MEQEGRAGEGAGGGDAWEAAEELERGTEGVKGGKLERGKGGCARGRKLEGGRGKRVGGKKLERGTATASAVCMPRSEHAKRLHRAFSVD
eukprot:294305-Chlamydomonas_euryale.AAC.1